MNAIDFLKQNPNHQLLTQIIYPKSKGYDTTVCFYNYYSQVVKQPVPCKLYIFTFDRDGRQVDFKTRNVSSDASVQVTLDTTDNFGTVAVAAIPDINLTELEKSGRSLRIPQATGYYTIWHKPNSSSLDTSHEWATASSQSIPTQTYYVTLPKSQWVKERGIILYNPSLTNHATATIKTGSNAQDVHLPPMSVIEVKSELKNDLDDLWSVTGPVAAPFSIEYHQSGDLHIHHS